MEHLLDITHGRKRFLMAMTMQQRTARRGAQREIELSGFRFARQKFLKH